MKMRQVFQKRAKNRRFLEIFMLYKKWISCQRHHVAIVYLEKALSFQQLHLDNSTF